MPSIDPAILKVLSIEASAATIRSHGGSGFTSTLRITTPSTSYFVKTSNSAGAATMFEGEHLSLNAINHAVPSLCPKSFAWGKLDGASSKDYFLATEFLDFSRPSAPNSPGGGSGMTLAQKLANLHAAPIPEEYQSQGFGFPATTCCGDTEQDNSFKPTWSEFFAQNRLLMILRKGEANNGRDPKLRHLIEQVVERVVPRLLGEGHLGGKDGIKPVVCHGDLWSGNKGKARFVGRDTDNSDEPGPVEDVVFDASAVYGHHEFDHGIMNMFGGFSGGFWEEYWKYMPKTQPVDEYEDRVKLYEAYHHLNHWSMFGGGYKGGAVSMLQGLLQKHG